MVPSLNMVGEGAMNLTHKRETYKYSHGETEPLGRADIVSAWLVALLRTAGLMLAA